MHECEVFLSPYGTFTLNVVVWDAFVINDVSGVGSSPVLDGLSVLSIHMIYNDCVTLIQETV